MKECYQINWYKSNLVGYGYYYQAVKQPIINQAISLGLFAFSRSEKYGKGKEGTFGIL